MAEFALSSVFKEYGQWERQPEHCYDEPILIFVDGPVTPMHVLESDSIVLVKLRMCWSLIACFGETECKGFVVKKQKLVFGDR